MFYRISVLERMIKLEGIIIFKEFENYAYSFWLISVSIAAIIHIRILSIVQFLINIISSFVCVLQFYIKKERKILES